MKSMRWPAAARRWLGAAAILAASTSAAWGDLTVQDLTSKAVPRGGPFYQDVNDAIRAFATRDYKTTLARLQNAKKLAPALAPAEVMMARLYFDAGIPRGGYAMLENAIKTSPQDPEAYLILAERALGDGRLSEASLLYPKIEQLVESFNQSPTRRQDMQMRAYTVGAAVEQARGNLAGAKSKLENLVRVDSENARAHEMLGRLLYAQKDQKGAYQQFQLAAKADEKALPAELVMATLSADNASAQRWLDHAVKVNPDDARTRVSIADFLLKTNRVDEALTHAEKAMQVAPDSFDSNLIAGLLARMTGDFENAVKYLSQAHLMRPSNYDVMHHLAMVLMELPDEESQRRATQFAELVVRQNPDNPDYLAGIGWINYRLNRKAAAERYFGAAFNTKRIKSSMALSSEMGYFLANLANDRGNTAEAVKLLRDALNTEQPFAYRKAAESLLAKLDKSGGAEAETAGQN